MATIEVTSDTNWSSLTINQDDDVWIKNDAKLTVDEKGECHFIRVGDASSDENGYLEFDDVVNITYKEPTIEFKDEEDAGFLLEQGEIGLSSSADFYNHRYILKSESENPDHKWMIRTTDESGMDFSKISFNNISAIEMFHLQDSIHIIHNNSFKDIYFERGYRDIFRSTSISTDVDAPLGGRATWNRFENSDGMEFEAIGTLLRRDGGKATINRLHIIATKEQRDHPILFVSEDIFTYARLVELEPGTATPFTYDIAMEFEEVAGEYEKY